MTRGIGVVAVAVGACALGGCASTKVSYVQLATPPRPMVPRPYEQVDTYVTTPPTRPHVDVGLLQVLEFRVGDDPVSPQEMVMHLKGGAATQGCDAVLITSVDMRSTRYRAPSMEGSCEMYTDAAATAPSQPTAPPPPPSPPPSPPVGTAALIGTHGVEIRTAPSLAAPVIMRLNPGLLVRVYPSSDGWRFVRLSDGRIGYISLAALNTP